MSTLSKKKYFWSCIGIIVFFLLICWRYSTQIEVWGDEAFSLEAAVNGWDWKKEVEVHLPTYYWLLELWVQWQGENQVVLIRLLHAIPFVIGSIFGLKTIERWQKSLRLKGDYWALSVFAASFSLPTFIFYATNIRMYSLLFLGKMAWIEAISRVLEEEEPPSLSSFLFLGSSGIFLIGIDYASVIYYFAGLGFLGLYAILKKKWQPFSYSLIALIPLVIINLKSIRNIQAIADFDTEATKAITWTGAIDFAKWVFLGLRPGLELINTATIPSILALSLPMLWLGFCAHNAFLLKKQSNELAISQTYWLIYIAFLWVCVIPTGYSFTRLFLPSQFFMVAILILGIPLMNKSKFILGFISLGLLCFLNLTQAINPTPKMFSLIPYPQVAEDIVVYGEENDISTVYLSGASLNVVSIKREIIKREPELQVTGLNEGAIADLQTTDSCNVIASYMEGGKSASDMSQLFPNAQLEQTYIELAELPFNSVWTQRWIQRSQQPYAVMTYSVNCD